MPNRTLRIAVLTVLVLIISAAGLAADPIEGFWKSVDEDGEPTAFWEIYIQNGMAFGRIVKIIGKPDDTIASKVEASYANHPESRALNTLPVIGVPWIYNLQPRRNEGQWTRGFIIDPNDGKRYALDVNFIPANDRKAIGGQETLEVKGKIAIFSRSQYWVRSSAAEVAAYRD
jgi:uncharacterized protein (DUF2147 family)